MTNKKRDRPSGEPQGTGTKRITKKVHEYGTNLRIRKKIVVLYIPIIDDTSGFRNNTKGNT